MKQQDRQKIRCRYIEIDVVRGLAVLGMIGFHAAFIAQFFFGLNLFSGSFFWEVVPICGNIFFILAGLSLYIGASQGKYPSLLPVIQKSGLLLVAGLFMTGITYLFDFGGKIYFGVLHCMGLATFISFLVLPLPKVPTLASGTLIIILGMYCRYIPRPCFSPSLYWLYPCFCLSSDHMLDYYPLIPSLGFMLLGIFLGKQCYPQGKRIVSPMHLVDHAFRISGLALIGRNALPIYFLHPPIIYAILYLMTQMGLF